MTDAKKPSGIPTIAGKSPDMTQNSNKIALLNEPGSRSQCSDHVESYTNILKFCSNNGPEFPNHVKCHTENQTPPSNKFSQIVHPNNMTTMNIGKHYKTPPANAKDMPKVTGSNCRKSAKTKDKRCRKQIRRAPGAAEADAHP
jgi:hypothetical protein